MELYKEILSKVIENGNVQVYFPDLPISATEIVQLECYQALHKIKAIIEDDKLSDQDCFMKIEEIICLFEKLGSDGGFRHDY